jgi:hypothetical protein
MRQRICVITTAMAFHRRIVSISAGPLGFVAIQSSVDCG